MANKPNLFIFQPKRYLIDCNKDVNNSINNFKDLHVSSSLLCGQTPQVLHRVDGQDSAADEAEEGEAGSGDEKIERLLGFLGVLGPSFLGEAGLVGSVAADEKGCVGTEPSDDEHDGPVNSRPHDEKSTKVCVTKGLRAEVSVGTFPDLVNHHFLDKIELLNKNFE